jgi:pimeloyl-ACP methyl ester carboxylesterase
MKTVQHLITNGDGWLLSLWQTWDPKKLVPGRRPVVIVPGYGMNSFIFSYHPNGLSLEGAIADAGYEVWRADLRGQGGSIRRGGSDNFSLESFAITDLGAALAGILDRTQTHATRVDVIGASLGGTLMFIHAALNEHHVIGSMVAMGSPLRWVRVHPVVRLLSISPRLVGLLPVRGTRRLAELGLPFAARRLPWLLSIYANPETSDLSVAAELARTVEDPSRFINREIGQWIHDKDLYVRGQNITQRLRGVTQPLMCVVAAHDGIVPRETAEFPYLQIGSTEKELLVVGDKTLAMAHADMFIANAAHERVFTPITDFLTRQYVAAAAKAGT